MYTPTKYYRRGRGRGRARGRGSAYRNFAYERSHNYRCEDCKIGCTSFKQLKEHLTGMKHLSFLEYFKKGNLQHMEEDTFSLEHMVVLDETEEDLPNDNAASPASCDSSDSATATTSDHFPSSHMVILDETNDDNDQPASPASCDSSASESAPSSSATVKILDVPTKKIKTEKHEDDQTAPVSPRSVRSSCHSSNPAAEAEAAHGSSRKYSSKKRYSNSGRTRHRQESIKVFHVEPIRNNQDVFKFLKTFAVANDSDVAFAKKVKAMFSNALMKYKQIKLEEICCTEAEHSPTEEPTVSTDDPCDDEQPKDSIPHAIKKSDCERTISAPGSPPNSSTTPSISNRTSSADRQPGSPITKQSDNPDASSGASRSLSCICEDTSNKQSAANSTNIDQSSVTEADPLMESEDCSVAEAACSDDEDE